MLTALTALEHCCNMPRLDACFAVDGFRSLGESEAGEDEEVDGACTVVDERRLARGMVA